MNNLIDKMINTRLTSNNSKEKYKHVAVFTSVRRHCLKEV